MPPIFSEITPSNGGALLLVVTTVVGSGGVYVYFWASEYFEMLILSVINAVKTWRFSVSSVIFSLVSLWFSVIRKDFLISILVVLIRLFLVGFNGGLDDEELFVRLGIHIVPPFWVLKLEV